MATVTKTKAEIIKDVRIVLDQNEDSSVLVEDIGDIDQTQTDDIVEECLKFAIDRIFAIAPLWTISDSVNVTNKTCRNRLHNTNAKYGKFVEINNDFLRIVSVMATDWEQPIYEIHDPSEPIYRKMKSNFAGLRGNINRPYVFLNTDPSETSSSAGKILEIYDTDDKDVYISYIPKIELSDSMAIPSLIYQSIIYMTASLYYRTLGQSSMSELMATTAMEPLKNYSDNSSDSEA